MMRLKKLSVFLLVFAMIICNISTMAFAREYSDNEYDSQYSYHYIELKVPVSASYNYNGNTYNVDITSSEESYVKLNDTNVDMYIYEKTKDYVVFRSYYGSDKSDKYLNFDDGDVIEFYSRFKYSVNNKSDIGVFRKSIIVDSNDNNALEEGYTYSVNLLEVAKYVYSTRNINVVTIWNDHNNQSGVRPYNTTVQLYANGYKLDGVTLDLTDSNNYSATWYGLPKMYNGNYINYSIQYENVKGYHIETYFDGNTFYTYMCHPNETKNIKVTKVWDDNGLTEYRPDSIDVQLYMNGVANGDVVTLSEDNEWTYVWSDLLVYEEGKAGEEITYTVEELYEDDNYVSSQVTEVIDESNTNVIITNSLITPTEEPEETESPVETIEPTEEPEETESPVETIEPTEEPGQTESPVETAEPTEEPVETESPVETIEPTEEPEETESPVETIEPTEEPEETESPVETAEPTEVPEETQIPETTVVPTENPTLGGDEGDTPIVSVKPGVDLVPTETPVASEEPDDDSDVNINIDSSEDDSEKDDDSDDNKDNNKDNNTTDSNGKTDDSINVDVKGSIDESDVNTGDENHLNFYIILMTTTLMAGILLYSLRDKFITE